MLSAREMVAEWIILGTEDIPTRIVIADEKETVLGVVHMHQVAACTREKSDF